MHWIIGAVSMIGVVVMMIILLIVGVAGYIGVEEVSCNALWCEFKLPIQTEIHQLCYQDGHQVNCSEILDNLNQIQLMIVNEQ